MFPIIIEDTWHFLILYSQLYSFQVVEKVVFHSLDLMFDWKALSYLDSLNILKNISQLKKFIEWILVMIDDNDSHEISKNNLHDLGINLLESNSKNSSDSMNLKIKDARDEFEKNYLMYNLEKFEYNVSKMSVEIGMERTALYRKLKLLKINMEIWQWK